jgi:hypothetical protein
LPKNVRWTPDLLPRFAAVQHGVEGFSDSIAFVSPMFPLIAKSPFRNGPYQD